ncbi:hypothetical protein N9J68_02520 [Gammaproteobacteria bacterium]|nr:hypothetical protein [Gammaproteobacteria bacterium]MDA9011100.1 hypothetical protein [Gammaproteobacteria bacterium]MDA9024728.1 hypothetical protein [Gammaproteobacteria bacterium]MDA9038444.1 hypothetical protein [Gammaproteobacteria bacterium]MDA9195950.1 hypothetical protein [Gammaproteobacteria bacterium]|tara:strand:- start:1948 stop:2457 length:510 start_codon:yes stop_codon:yes gene_type:complete
MKINNLYMTLVVILYSTNITADGNHGDFQCYSSDPEMGDSAYWAGEAIESFAQNQFEEAIHIVDACFDVFATEAVIMQKELDANKVKYPPIGRVTRNEKEKIHKNYAVNDVSMALWAKARSLEEIGKINLAKNAYSKCMFLAHGRAWDPKGWFWNPAADCVNRARKLLE